VLVARAFARLLDEEVKKMPKTITNKTTRADRIRKIKAGLQKYYPTTSLKVGGTDVQPAAMQSQLQGDIDANDASRQAKANWIVTVNAAKQADASIAPILRTVRNRVLADFGDAPNAEAVLADFGYAPRKKGVTSVQTKADAIAKSKATREARHTMGPKAKLQVKGVVPSTGGAAAEPAVNATPAPVVTSNPASTSSQGASPSGSTSKSSP
jgi:hypothetical protein